MARLSRVPALARGQRFNEVQAKAMAQAVGVPIAREVVAAAAGTSFADLAQITTANAARVYRLPGG